jgi:shikimate dehydrogenase
MRQDVSGKTSVYAVIGDEISHSLSPALHNRWFRELGFDSIYVALQSAPGAPHPLRAMQSLGLVGVNLTAPHKITALAYLDALDPTAQAIGAVNTVIRRGDRLHGANTDGPGLLRALQESGGSPASAAILGSGGAARAAHWALRAHGVQQIVVLGRAPKPASPHLPEVRPLTPSTFRHPDPPYDLIVHALPPYAEGLVGSILDPSLSSTTRWVDLNYEQPDPPWVRELRRRGHDVQRGTRMLLHQAALAFSLFTGTFPDLELVEPQLKGPQA